MIERYTRPKMGDIWSEANRFKTMVRVEVIACESFAKQGLIPKQALNTIRKRAVVNPKRIQQLEEKTRHDVVAFLENLRETVGPAARYIHLGLTSSDVVDTTLAVLMRESATVLIDDVDDLIKVLGRQAKKYKMTPMIGRTHGVHAEPTTFGLKMALFYEEMRRHRERLLDARQAVSVGKLSGAVGTYSAVHPSVEAYVCRRLGLTPEPLSTQVVQRDRHAQFLTTIALVGASCEKLATEIRHLQRTEVLEVEEPFRKGQKGSSAMPHKRNPVNCERITGLARILRGHALAGMENVALWHERDISHSSVERVILPDSTILLDFMLSQLTQIVAGLQVYPKRMLENLQRSRGLAFSSRVLVEMVKQGADRLKAYEAVQAAAMKSWQSESAFLELLREDALVRKYLPGARLDRCFRYEDNLRHVNRIFKRIGL